MLKKMNRFILFILAAGIMLLLLIKSAVLAEGIRQGISICLTVLIPSMFLFLFLSSFFASTFFNQILCYPFRWISRHWFKLDGQLFSIVLFSLIGGYPVGPRLIAQRIQEGVISPKEGEQMLCYCINGSPAFLLCGVSLTLWGSLLPGFILYLSQVLACFLIARLSSLNKPTIICHHSPVQNQLNCAAALVQSTESAIRSMTTICGYVLLFCGLFRLIDLLALPQLLQLPLKGILEVTSGCQMLTDISWTIAAMLAGLFTSFGGVCVFLQISAMLRGTGVSMKKALIWRPVYTALSLLFSWIGLQWVQPAVSCFLPQTPVRTSVSSVSPWASVLLLGLGILVLAAQPKNPIPSKQYHLFEKNGTHSKAKNRFLFGSKRTI